MRRPSGPAGRLVGTWQQSGSTGDWPRVVNLWEMDGWDGWADILEYQYAPRSGQPPALRKWWTEAWAADNGGAKGFVDLLVQRFAASPVDGNHRRESARYLSHPRNIVVITTCRQVVIVSDHFLGRNYRSRAKVQLLPPWQFGFYPGKPVIAFGKGLAPPFGR